MKKKFTVTAYEAYDFTEDLRLGNLFETIPEAEEKIRLDDTERREDWRKFKGNIATYVPYKYLIIEMVGTVESKLINNWKEGVIEEFELKDL